MPFKAICLIICSLCAAADAAALEICGDLKQGELLYLKHDFGNDNYNKVLFNNNLGKKVYFSDKFGRTPIAMHRDAEKNVNFTVYDGHDEGKKYELPIAPATWDIQRINGVAQSKVTPTSAADLAEIKREQNDVNMALAGTKRGGMPSQAEDSYGFWSEGFILPVEGRISGNFGNQRIFNGTPKSPHSGTDIAAPEGTPVKASGSGVVVLSGKDYFYTGNMVIIDHGHQLKTIYAHLQKAAVKAGDKVRQGDVIGYVGKTGRATGAHLHWGASLNNVRFRPHSLLNLNEKECVRLEEK